MKLDNLNWDIVPARFTELREVPGQGRYRFVDPVTLHYSAGLSAFERSPDVVHSPDTCGATEVTDWPVVATRPVEDKVEFWIKRSLDMGSFSGPYTREAAIQHTSEWARANRKTYTIVRIIPAFEVSAVDVVVKEL